MRLQLRLPVSDILFGCVGVELDLDISMLVYRMDYRVHPSNQGKIFNEFLVYLSRASDRVLIKFCRVAIAGRIFKAAVAKVK